MRNGKVLRIVSAIALILSLTLMLAACGNDQSEPRVETAADNQSNTQEEAAASEDWRIGFNVWGTAGNPTFDLMAEIIGETLMTLGTRGSRANDDHMADRTLENIQNFISAGVDGLVMQAAAPPVLPPAAEASMNSQIPFVLGINTGGDDDRAVIAANNPYYVGSVSADMVRDGEIAAQQALDDGHRTAILIGGNVGNKHQDDRVAGFTQVFESGGGVVLDAARCTSPAETQEKATALLSANRDADCIYAMVGDYIPGTVVAADLLDLSHIPIYASNINTDSVEHMRSGRVVAGGTGNDLAGGIAAAMLINHLDGHAILDADGNKPELIIYPFIVTADNVDNYIAIFNAPGVSPFHEEIARKLSWRYNSDVTYQTFLDVINNDLTLEGLMAAHGF